MKSANIRLILAVLSAALLVAGCSKPDTEQAPPAEASAAQAATPALATLATYEALRAKLAGDEMSGVAELSASLHSTASAAAKQESGPAAEALDALAKAATTLKASTKLDDARLAFGEVSRGLVGLLAARPELRAGRYVFECPMASGYKKWVQTTDKMSNPYMGKRMLECGAESAWSA